MPLPGFRYTIVWEQVVGTSADEDGRTTDTYADPMTLPNVGAGMVDIQEQSTAAAQGQVYDAVVLIPRDSAAAVIAPPDRVTLGDDIGPPLAGVYRVATVRWNPHHLRVMLARVTN